MSSSLVCQEAMEYRCKVIETLLWSLVLLPLVYQCAPAPQPRQQGPIDAALTGFFSPPFVVLVGMGALAYTFEKFARDVVKAATDRSPLRLRRRRKKKPTGPPQAPGAKDNVREHRNVDKVVKKGQKS